MRMYMKKFYAPDNLCSKEAKWSEFNYALYIELYSVLHTIPEHVLKFQI